MNLKIKAYSKAERKKHREWAEGIIKVHGDDSQMMMNDRGFKEAALQVSAAVDTLRWLKTVKKARR